MSQKHWFYTPTITLFNVRLISQSNVCVSVSEITAVNNPQQKAEKDQTAETQA